MSDHHTNQTHPYEITMNDGKRACHNGLHNVRPHPKFEDCVDISGRSSKAAQSPPRAEAQASGTKNARSSKHPNDRRRGKGGRPEEQRSGSTTPENKQWVPRKPRQPKSHRKQKDLEASVADACAQAAAERDVVKELSAELREVKADLADFTKTDTPDTVVDIDPVVLPPPVDSQFYDESSKVEGFSFNIRGKARSLWWTVLFSIVMAVVNQLVWFEAIVYDFWWPIVAVLFLPLWWWKFEQWRSATAIMVQYQVVSLVKSDQRDLRWDVLSQSAVKHNDPIFARVACLSIDPEGNRVTERLVVSMELFCQLTCPANYDFFIKDEDMIDRIRLTARTTQSVKLNKYYVFEKQDVVQNTALMAIAYVKRTRNVPAMVGFLRRQ